MLKKRNEIQDSTKAAAMSYLLAGLSVVCFLIVLLTIIFLTRIVMG